MRRTARTFKRLGSCENGSVAVEFAFIGMLLIAGSLIAIDFGRAFFLYNKMSSAVDRASRKSLVFNTTDAQLISEIMRDFPGGGTSGGDNPPAEAPRVTVTAGTDFRTVKVDMAFKPVVPAFVSHTLNLSLSRRFPKAS
jgi:Flp pilus assembly protein TadG